MADEFQEIGHCGGTVTFTVVTDENGRRSLQVGIRHSRPTAAAFFGIWALPQGIPIAHMPIGGIGSETNPPPVMSYPVYIASDSTGMFGHECPRCGQYWRARGGAAVCPYCGLRADLHQFLTKAQRRYVSQYCERVDAALSDPKDGDHVIDMDAVADAVGKEIEKPPFYYAEQSQQNKYECEACGSTNDILGSYGYCTTCGTRNDLQELEGSIQQLRERINSGTPKENCVRDAVATFDSYVAQYAGQLLKRVPMTAARRAKLQRSFQDLEIVVDVFQECFGIDLKSGMAADDYDFAKLMFHRRHVYEHRGGEADEKYIKESGDTSVRLKQALHETQASAHRIANLVMRMARNLHDGFHEIFKPIDGPIKWHTERKKRMKER